jgi:hypothetical protein
MVEYYFINPASKSNETGFRCTFAWLVLRRLSEHICKNTEVIGGETNMGRHFSLAALFLV